MPRSVLSRRAFLVGAGSVAVSLPLLDAMRHPARVRAELIEPPKRFLVCFSGMSTGAYRSSNLCTPTTVGADYDLPRALAPLAELGNVKTEFSIVSGLKVPWGPSDAVPAAGRPVEFHSSTLAPMFCGVRTTGRDRGCAGPTSDQIVAETIGADTRFRSLEYRVQAAGYRGGEGPRGAMSYKRDGSGTIVRNTPIASPRIAYDSLFTGFTPDDPAEIERRRFMLERDGSVLDLVDRKAQRLMSRVSAADRLRLERHFDEIRALERRIAETPPDPMGACALLPDPGEDAPIAILGGGGGDSTDTGYADEEHRASVLFDLLHMAFTCDLTRSATLMFTFAQSFMNMGPLMGNYTDLHNLGHGGGDADDTSDAYAWHVRHLARFVAKLRDTPEGDGSVLDNTVVVFVTEGGWGYDPEGDSADTAHSSENMIALVAGRAGGIARNRHIVATDAHPASVILTAMHAVGVDGGLGEISATVPSLLA